MSMPVFKVIIRGQSDGVTALVAARSPVDARRSLAQMEVHGIHEITVIPNLSFSGEKTTIIDFQPWINPLQNKVEDAINCPRCGVEVVHATHDYAKGT